MGTPYPMPWPPPLTAGLSCRPGAPTCDPVDSWPCQQPGPVEVSLRPDKRPKETRVGGGGLGFNTPPPYPGQKRSHSKTAPTMPAQRPKGDTHTHFAGCPAMEALRASVQLEPSGSGDRGLRSGLLLGVWGDRSSLTPGIRSEVPGHGMPRPGRPALLQSSA